MSPGCRSLDVSHCGIFSCGIRVGFPLFLLFIDVFQDVSSIVNAFAKLLQYCFPEHDPHK